ncbi:hypothetical protein ODV15_06185 [Lactobacillus amylovorus]|uniref:Surface layer protein A domain-containing protein n=1 Tax=Lactobacillus amylovorus TaxID=1604 RepID=A0A9X3WAJ9_LACAM|nr:hypothetical protein [Lactobacillus amylovorus]MDB6262149.1 hypothetical protein [Lactobacillus amylovorus]
MKKLIKAICILLALFTVLSFDNLSMPVKAAKRPKSQLVKKRKRHSKHKSRRGRSAYIPIAPGWNKKDHTYGKGKNSKERYWKTPKVMPIWSIDSTLYNYRGQGEGYTHYNYEYKVIGTKKISGRTFYDSVGMMGSDYIPAESFKAPKIYKANQRVTVYKYNDPVEADNWIGYDYFGFLPVKDSVFKKVPKELDTLGPDDSVAVLPYATMGYYESKTLKIKGVEYLPVLYGDLTEPGMIRKLDLDKLQPIDKYETYYGVLNADGNFTPRDPNFYKGPAYDKTKGENNLWRGWNNGIDDEN